MKHHCFLATYVENRREQKLDKIEHSIESLIMPRNKVYKTVGIISIEVMSEGSSESITRDEHESLNAIVREISIKK